MKKPTVWKGLVVASAIAITPACLCESEFCRVGTGGGIAIGSGSGASAPYRPLAPPIDMKVPGILTDAEWRTLQYLAWPQTKADMLSTFGQPSRIEGTQAIYGIPGGDAIAILYEGDQATGYIFWSEEDQDYVGDYDPTVYELHGAVTEADCWRMLQRFRAEGRRLDLIDTVRTNNKGAVLKYQCVFDGEDANPVDPPFEDRRYNSPDEYAL